MGALVIAFGLHAFGAARVSVLSPIREAGPGEFVTHVFSVLNEGGAAATFRLELEVPPRWGLLGVPPELALATGEEGTLFVTVTVPPGATAGEYQIVLYVVSAADPEDRASASALISVRAENAVSVSISAGQSVVPGGEARYDVTLVNRGNVQDVFRVEAISGSGFRVALSRDLVSLAPQERGTVEVRVQVPGDAAPGRDILTVRATSTVYSAVKEEAVVFSTTLPPPPQVVGGTLFEELPVRLELLARENLLTGSVLSDLVFSVAGAVGGGYLSAFARASPLFGPSSLEVDSFLVYYRRTPTTYTIGDVLQRLTDLSSVSCRGGSVLVDEERYDVRFVAGGRDGETRVGGYLALGPEEANLGIAHTDRREGADQKTVWSLTAACEPLEDVRLRLEGALGINGGLTSHAFFFNTTVDTSGYFLSGEAFSVGTYFPELRADEAGIALSQRLRLPGLSLAASLAHRWDNVIGDPRSPTTTSDELGLNVLLVPGEPWPTIAGTVEFSWDRSGAPAPSSDLERLLSITLGRSEGAFPYAFSGRWKDQVDALLGTHLRILSFSEGAGLSLEGFYLFLRLTQEEVVDAGTGALLSGGTDVSLSVRPKGALHSASLTWMNEQDVSRLSLDLDVHILEGFHVVFSGALGFDRTDAAAATFECGITFNLAFDLPVPFLVTKGRVEGRVFLDRDGDGRWSPADQGVGKAVVSAGQSRVSTDETGQFRFPPFGPGSYVFSVSDLPSAAAPPRAPQVELRAGKTVWIDIPLSPVVLVSGVLFNDADRSGTFSAGEGGFAQVRVLLLGTDGAAIGEAHTDGNGRFEFRQVRPGTYTVAVDRTTLPERFVFTTPESASVTIGAGAPTEVLLGGTIRPKAVVITFQPPTADFAYTPAHPKPGSPVHFDASASFDFDGEIVLYEWDFNGDGARDAVGPTADHGFPSAGSYDVTLTVTDDSGSSDSITITVTVD